jgi:hypothetical protein
MEDKLSPAPPNAVRPEREATTLSGAQRLPLSLVGFGSLFPEPIRRSLYTDGALGGSVELIGPLLPPHLLREDYAGYDARSAARAAGSRFVRVSDGDSQPKARPSLCRR